MTRVWYVQLYTTYLISLGKFGLLEFLYFLPWFQKCKFWKKISSLLRSLRSKDEKGSDFLASKNKRQYIIVTFRKFGLSNLENYLLTSLSFDLRKLRRGYGIFLKNLKSGQMNKIDELCLSFVVKVFAKSHCIGGLP